MLPLSLTQAFGPAGVISHALALEHCSDKVLAGLVRKGDLVRLWRGAYALPDHQTRVETRLRAADLTFGTETVACLHTAAELFGFDTVGDGLTHVLAPADNSRRVGRLIPHRYRVTAPLVTINGRRATHPTETALCVAALQGNSPRALAVLDAAVRSGCVHGPDLLTTAAERLSVNRIRSVRQLIPWVDGRAESPPESWMRWVFLDAGLPAPSPQFWVSTDEGPRRLDLAWPEFKVGAEYDGVAFHTGEALFRDRARLNALIATGWRIVHVTSAMIWHDRPAIVGRVRDLLDAVAA